AWCSGSTLGFHAKRPRFESWRCGGRGCWKMAIREYSFEACDFCGLLTLQPVTSNSAYRNRVCVHITSLELTVRKTYAIYTKKYTNNNDNALKVAMKRNLSRRTT